MSIKKRLISRILIILLIIGSINVTNICQNSEKTSVYAATLKLKSGKHEQYIDRMKFPDYALNFYYDLEKNSKNAGGYLVDPSKASVYENNMFYEEITSVTGTVVASSDSEARAYLEKKASSSEITDYLYESYFAFFCDHPEVFWIDQSPRLKYRYSATVDRTTGVYSYEIDYINVLKDYNEPYDIRDTAKYKTLDSLVKAINKRDKLVKKIVKKYKTKSAYKTVQGFNKYLVSKNTYNSILLNGKTGEAEYTHHAMCALEGNSGKKGPICMAYASALKVLCDAAGIPCIIVCGDATNAKGITGGHQWNNVRLENGKWYAVDSTWNDTGNVPEAYFCVGSKTKIAEVAFAKSHKTYNKGYQDLKGLTNQPKMAKGKFSYDGIKVVLSKKNYVYTGSKLTPKVTVYNIKGKKIAKKYYKVKYSNNKNVGTATVKVTFKGKYKKTTAKKVYFTISPNNPTISSYGRFGNAITININTTNQVVDGYEVVYSPSSDFNIKYSASADVPYGESSVVIDGLEKDTIYYAKVRSYTIKKGKFYYSNYSGVSTLTVE